MKRCQQKRQTYLPAVAKRSNEQTDFLREKIQQANEACQSGNFAGAVELFTEIISTEPNNPIGYCNRSAAYIRMKQFKQALHDGIKTIILDPKWQKGYYRQAVALSHMGRYMESLASYASALAHDCRSHQLLQALVDAALKSPLQETLEPLLDQLDLVDTTTGPFATVALIGQEVLAAGDVQSAITILESSLEVATSESLLKGSVYSALSSAYWTVDNVKRSLHYMHEELKVAEQQNDVASMCRVHGNLGSAHFVQEQYSEARHHHMVQYEMAEEMKHPDTSCYALSALGHVYVSLKNYTNALQSHKKCALLRKQMGDSLNEARELSNVANVYFVMGDLSNAEQCFEEGLKILEKIEQPLERCKCLNSVGSLYQSQQRFSEALLVYEKMLEIAQQDELVESWCQALSGMGHNHRMQGNLHLALKYHQQQLERSKSASDFVRGCALADLGVCYQHTGVFEQALKCHHAHLTVCRKLNDKNGEVKAYGNVGNAYQMLEKFEKAVKYHQLGLSCAIDLKDKYSEALLHGNLGVAFQSLSLSKEAKENYEQHLKISKDNQFLRSECVAESNLGNFYSGSELHKEAIPHYENHLSVATRLQDKHEMCKAAQNLAHTYYSTGEYTESISHYEQCLQLAMELNDEMVLSSAYGNVGLVYVALSEFEKAVRCQKLHLASAREKKNTRSVCKAYGNLGRVYMKMGDYQEANDFFQQQLQTVEQLSSIDMKCECLREYGKALAEENLQAAAFEQFEKEIALRRKTPNERGKLYDSLVTFATFLESIDELTYASKCYMEVFNTSQAEGDVEHCRKSCQLLGDVHMLMQQFEKALGWYRRQLECMEEFVLTNIEAGRTHVKMSNCYERLHNFESALRHLQEYLNIALASMNYADENEANKALSKLCEKNNDLKAALLYSEKRLISVQELSESERCSAYRDVARSHTLLKNFDSAMSYYNKLLIYAKQYGNLRAQYDAYQGMGTVSSEIEHYAEALKWHLQAEETATGIGDQLLKTNTLISIGDCHQRIEDFSNALNNYQEALRLCQEHDLQTLGVTACGCIGKTHHSLGNPEESISYLRMSSSLSEQLTPDESLKCFYRLGLKLFLEREFVHSRKCLQKVTSLVEDSPMQLLGSDSQDLQFVTCAYKILQVSFVAEEDFTQALYTAEKANNLTVGRLLSKCDIKVSLKPPAYSSFVERLTTVDKSVCYYSIVLGDIYCWIVEPGVGFVKFWKTNITGNWLASMDLDRAVDELSTEAGDILHSQVTSLRRSIDVGKCSRELTRVKRSDSFVSANIETVASPRNKSFKFRYRQPESPSKNSDKRSSKVEDTSELYTLLVAPLDIHFEVKQSLVVVLPAELSLVPFAVLKDEALNMYACEKYNFTYNTTLFSLFSGNPSVEVFSEETSTVFSGATCDDEALRRVLGSGTALVKSSASKDEVLSQLSRSTVNHLNVDVIWHLPMLCFPIADGISQHGDLMDNLDLDDKRQVVSPDIIVSVKDLTDTDLSRCKLLHFGGASLEVCSEGMQAMTTVALMAGAQTVVTSQWQVSQEARDAFEKTFYHRLTSGTPARQAFHETVHSMRVSEQLRHPSNWAGWAMHGSDCQLADRTTSFTKSFHQFLECPDRDAIKVVLHLIETAHKRLAQDVRTSLYVSESSIETKINSTNVVWRPLLLALGFRFERSQMDATTNVFFPEYEFNAVLNKRCNTLYAFLGLTKTGLTAIARLRNSPHVATPLLEMFHSVLHYFDQGVANVQHTLPLGVWRVQGCHELLSALSFDVMGVGRSDVTLRSGRLETKKLLQCAAQALKDLYDDNERNQINNEEVTSFETRLEENSHKMTREEKREISNSFAENENEYAFSETSTDEANVLAHKFEASLVISKDDVTTNDVLDDDEIVSFAKRFGKGLRKNGCTSSLKSNDSNGSSNASLQYKDFDSYLIPNEYTTDTLQSRGSHNDKSDDEESLFKSKHGDKRFHSLPQPIKTLSISASFNARYNTTVKSRNSSTSSVDSKESRKKKISWFQKMKKANSIGNLLQEDAVWTLEQSPKTRKKRGSMENLLSLGRQTNNNNKDIVNRNQSPKLKQKGKSPKMGKKRLSMENLLNIKPNKNKGSSERKHVEDWKDKSDQLKRPPVNTVFTKGSKIQISLL